MLKWFQSASAKCERLGHKYEIEWWNATVEQDGTTIRGVADEAAAQLRICKRCGRKELLKATERKRIMSLSMPGSMWAEFKRHGYILNRKIIAPQEAE